MHKNLQHIGISISYDMGWKKHSTGRIYDSLSGHRFFIGTPSKDVVQLGLMQKSCSACATLNHNSLAFDDHDCNVNWKGSSGAMEAGLAFELVGKNR